MSVERSLEEEISVDVFLGNFTRKYIGHGKNSRGRRSLGSGNSSSLCFFETWGSVLFQEGSVLFQDSYLVWVFSRNMGLGVI